MSGAAAPEARAQGIAARSWGEAISQLRAGRAPGRSRASLTGPRPAAAATALTIIAESEPNNTFETADSAALDVQVTGALNPAGDPDAWFLDLTAGQYVSIDLDAQSIGSPLDARLFLIGPDGEVAFNSDFDGLDPRISYRVTQSGRYLLVLPALGNQGGPEYTYAITFGLITCDPVGTEREPNDTPATASPAEIGASVSGEICAPDVRPEGDVDYWAFTGQAGTTIELDLDAFELGRLVDPVMVLYAADGTTRLTFDNDDVQLDPRVRYSITTTGTYYVSVAHVRVEDPNRVSPFPYTLHLRTIPPGPGDPTTVRAEGLGLPLGMAVGPTGDVYVADLSGSRVLRVSGQGTVSAFAPIVAPLGLAFDAFGALLVVSADGDVHRVTPEGQATRFITDATFPVWIAVAPDGRIWLTDVSDQSLRRYSPTGEFEARIDGTAAGGLGPGPLAFSPSGEPHFSTGSEIWKLANGELRRVLAYDGALWAFAFDVTGSIYVPTAAADRIVLFDPAGSPLVDPFVVAVHSPLAVAFGRDAGGATVARLFATESELGRIVEVDAAALAHPGLPVGARTGSGTFTVEIAAQALLGADGLSDADLEFLDAQGNRNGRYDVGDLQAYIRATGGLTGAAPNQRPRRGSDR